MVSRNYDKHGNCIARLSFRYREGKRVDSFYEISDDFTFVATELRDGINGEGWHHYVFVLPQGMTAYITGHRWGDDTFRLTITKMDEYNKNA